MDLKELEIFDRDSLSGRSTSSPVIMVNQVSGAFILNTALLQQIGIANLQEIALSRSKVTGSWYVMKVNSGETRGGFPVRVYEGKGYGTFTCKSLAFELMKDFKIKNQDSQKFSIDIDHPIPAGDLCATKLI